VDADAVGDLFVDGCHAAACSGGCGGRLWHRGGKRGTRALFC
jgi:hypothetical protein